MMSLRRLIHRWGMIGLLLLVLVPGTALAQEATPEPSPLPTQPQPTPELPTAESTELPTLPPATPTPPGVEVTPEVTALPATPAVPPEAPTLPASPAPETPLPAERTAGGLPIHPQPVLPGGENRVIVELAVRSRGGAVPGAADSAAYTADIATARDSLLAAMDSYPMTINHTYDFIPFIAVTTDQAGVAALRALPQVASVTPDELNFPALSSSTTLIGAQNNGFGSGAWTQGYDGTGWVVAVLDDGIDSDHPIFTGKIITAAEACFSSGFGFPGTTSNCPNGLFSQTGAGAASNSRCVTNFTGTSEKCSHGTHVAGIAVGDNGGGLRGVGKGAQLVMVNVFSRVDDCSSQSGLQPCLSGFDSDILAGLNHVYTQRVVNGLNIASVNLSLGGSVLYTNTCDAQKPSYVSAFANLRSVGIAPVVASGNAGSLYGISSPACVSNAISVGSVNNSSASNPDQISVFSNAAWYMSLLAPGGSIYSSYYNNAYATLSGTSMATPHVAGAFAVLRQAAPEASVDALLAALRNTGTYKTDVTGYSFPRINLNLALNYGLLDMLSPGDGQQVFGTMPALTFSPALGGATHYRILAAYEGASNYTFDRWYAVGSGANFANCTSTTCTVQPDMPLSGLVGTHNIYWWVQPYNTTHGTGQLFGPLIYAAQAINQSSSQPSGMISTASGRPEYTWPEVPGAAFYQLYVWSLPAWTTSLDLWIPAADANCSGGTCAYTPPAALVNGDFMWYVRSFGAANGYAPWSSGRSFTLNAAAPPIPTGLMPTSTTLMTNTVDFRWDEQPSASWYELIVVDPAGALAYQTWHAINDLVRDNGDYVKTLTLNGAGAFTWYVRAYGPGGFSASYAMGMFTIDAVSPPTGLSANDDQLATNRGDLTFSWNHNPRNTAYELYIGTTGYAAQIYYGSVSAAQAGCSTTCTFKPNVTLTNGSFIAHVRGQGAAGYTQGGTYSNGWSDAKTISIALPAPNASTFDAVGMGVFAGETLSNDDRPDFRITDIPNASWYRILVTNPAAQVVLDQWFQRSLLSCASGFCEITGLAFYPSNGTHQWWVSAWGPGGFANNGDVSYDGSGWRGPVAFTMSNTNIITSQVGQITTTNTNTNRPTFTWNPLTDTNWYQVAVWRRNNPAIPCEQGWLCQLVFLSNYTRLPGANGVPRSMIAGVDLLDATYQVYVQGWNGSGFSPWSGPSTFTIDVPDPGLAGLEAPAANGIIPQNTVNFTFTAGTNTTFHWLEIINSAGASVYGAWFSRADAACAGADTACAINGIPLVGGLYSYRLYSYNLGINPPNVNNLWTAYRAFRVLD